MSSAPWRNIKGFGHLRFIKSFWLKFYNGSLWAIFLFLKLIEAYLINTQIVFKNIITEKYYKKGGSELRSNI